MGKKVGVIFGKNLKIFDLARYFIYLVVGSQIRLRSDDVQRKLRNVENLAGNRSRKSSKVARAVLAPWFHRSSMLSLVTPSPRSPIGLAALSKPPLSFLSNFQSLGFLLNLPTP